MIKAQKSELFLFLILFFLISGCHESAESESGKSNRHVDKKESVKGANSNEQAVLNRFAEVLDIQYRVINNRVLPQCEKSIAEGKCFLAEFTLTTSESIVVPNWKIFFSFMTPVRETLSEDFNIFQVNGDLHYLQSDSPQNKNFNEWQAHDPVTIQFKAAFWQISEFDVPPNFYVTAEGLEPVLIKSTLSVIEPETQLETLPFAGSIIDKEKQFKRTSEDQSIRATAKVNFERNVKQLNGIDKVQRRSVYARVIPKPLKQTFKSDDSLLELKNGIFIKENEFAISETNPAFERLKQFGIATHSTNGIPVEILRSTKLDGQESYTLNVTAEKIVINARQAAGAFYAVQSLNSLLDIKTKTIPFVLIEDSPRFSFRGLHLDVARNFRDHHFVIKLLDQMSAYKLNKLHLHLGDDEGWRLEIPDLPELTRIGAFRCHDLSERECLLPQLGSGPFKDNENNGFYAIGQYQQILTEAKKRHIQVIPSFDMPGHSRAAVKSMLVRYQNLVAEGKSELAEEFLLSDLNDQSIYQSVQYYNDNTLNVCKESTYRFVEKVLENVIKIHAAVDVPLTTYHIGADETAGAWNNSPECNQLMQQKNLKAEQLSDYFVTKVAHFLASKNIQVAGWSDGLENLAKEDMPDNVQINAWKPLFWEGHKVAHEGANKNWQVVISSPDVTYFDFPYAADPKERGYYWGSRYTDTRQVFEFMPENLPIHAEFWTDRENKTFKIDDSAQPANDKHPAYLPMNEKVSFVGMQGHLWSEMVRSDAIAEYMLFPRLTALAERAWHKDTWEVDYDHQGRVFSQSSQYFNVEKRKQRNLAWFEFSSALVQKEFPKLEMLRWNYRLPTLGAVVSNNQLRINSPFPGLKMEYQIDGKDWTEYKSDAKGIEVSGCPKIFVRSRSNTGFRVSRSLLVESCDETK